MSDHLNKYVKAQLREGFSRDQIRTVLEREGFSDQRIDQVLGPERSIPWLPILGAVVLVVVVGTIVLLYFPLQGPLEREPGRVPAVAPALVECQDFACFVTRANECLPATFKLAEQGSIIRYETRNCVLTKEIIQFSEQESDSVIVFLAGKQMACPYQKFAFHPAFAEGLRGGLELCSGPLKDALINLLA